MTDTKTAAKNDPGADASKQNDTSVDPNSKAEQEKVAKAAADIEKAQKQREEEAKAEAKKQAELDAKADADAAAELAAKEAEANANSLSVKELEATLGGERASEEADGISEDREVRGKASAEKLQKLVDAIPDTSDRNHVMFGYAGVTITVGDLKNLFGKD